MKCGIPVYGRRLVSISTIEQKECHNVKETPHSRILESIVYQRALCMHLSVLVE
jgi:hypothetical protein